MQRRSLLALFTAHLIGLLAWSGPSVAESWEAFAARLKNGGAFVAAGDGEMLLCHRCDERFIPASTIKLATALSALQILGRNYRFDTRFSLRGQDVLVVRGSGDPSLTSEALAGIARELARRGLKRVSKLVLDDTYFERVTVDGRSDTSNPYDAQNGALLANFNTVAVTVTRRRTIEPGESQTPLTPVARSLAAGLPPGTHRVNLGADRERCLRYFGELLLAFLAREGVDTGQGIDTDGHEAPGDRPFFRHASDEPLEEIIRSMLKFSTNLAANQLLLTVGAERLGPPATVAKGVQVVRSVLKDRAHWRDAQLVEGSGLSRQTRVTPREMVMLVDAFSEYEDLLPLDEGSARIKTGTLEGVNTIVGTFESRHHGKVRFALLVNSAVPFAYKFQLLHDLEARL